MLLANEASSGPGNILAFDANRCGSKTFRKLQIGFESLFVLVPILFKIDVNGKEFRVHATCHASSTSQKILGTGIAGNADGNTLANRPILLNVLLIHVGG